MRNLLSQAQEDDSSEDEADAFVAAAEKLDADSSADQQQTIEVGEAKGEQQDGVGVTPSGDGEEEEERRELCHKVQEVVEHRWFERTIMFAIFLTSMQLAAYDPCDDDSNSVKSKVDKYLDYVFLGVFTVELILKHIAYGFCVYWAGGWNRLDALVVSTGFVTLAPGMDSLVAIRLLRILRPLRIVNKLQGMKQILQTLAAAAVPLADTALLCCLLFFLFGIVATTLFPGMTRQHCYNVVTSGGGTVSYELDTTIEYSYGVAMCGGEHMCTADQVCSYSRDAPNFGLTAFDNIFVAFLSIFVAVTLEGWVDVMYMLQDTYGYWPATIFFHLLIILASMFAVNLALAVLADSFDFAIDQAEDELDEGIVFAEATDGEPNAKTDAFGRPLRKRVDKISRPVTAAEKEEAAAVQADKEAGLSKLALVRGSRARSRARSMGPTPRVLVEEEEEDGQDGNASKFCCKKSAQSVYPEEPRSPTSGEWPSEGLSRAGSHLGLSTVEIPESCCVRLQLKFKQVAAAPVFDDLIMLFIILNTVCLALEHKQTKVIDGVEQAADMEQSWQDALDYSNYCFVFVFSIEVLFKLVGFGPAKYFSVSFNCFDFGVVLSSYVELALAGESAFSALRTFRLMRVFKLTKRWTSMRIILNTVLDTLPQMGYLMLMLCLFMFLASVAGMQLFGCKLKPPLLEDAPRANFDHFGVAMLTVFQILGGENWNDVMYNSIEATSPLAALYFLFLVVVGTFIVLNLTLAILLSNFGTGSSPELNCEEIALAIRDFVVWSTSCCCKCGRRRESASVEPLDKYEPDGSNKGLDAEPKDPWGDTSPDSDAEESDPSQMVQSIRGDVLTPISPKRRLSVNAMDQNNHSNLRLPPLGGLPSLGQERIRSDLKLGECPPKLGEVNARRKSFFEMVDVDNKVGTGDPIQDRLAQSVGRLVSHLAKMHTVEQFRTNWLVSTAVDGLDLVPLTGSMLSSVQQQVDDEARIEAELDERRDCTGCVVPDPEPLTGVSLWIFSPKSGFRKMLSRFVIHPMFDNFILLMIVASSVTLALEEPGLDENSTLAKWLHILDFVFTAIFTIEMIFKVIVSNFMLDANAYMRSGFNVLDFSIVCVSILSCTGALASDGLRALRTFRALKPLRTIKRAPGLRCVVEAILRCMPGFINIALVSSVCYLVFAILGVQFWAGKFWKCSDDSVASVEQCVGTADDGSPRQWQNAPINFDNVSNGMLSLFEIASMELWLDVMYNAMDVPSEIGLQPVQDEAWYFAIYFVIFIIIARF